MTDLFLHNIMAIHPKSISVETYQAARRCFLDYLGCTLAGNKLYKEKESAYLNSLVADIGNATIIGHHRKVPQQTAALINGINAHVAELDDGHRIGMVHLGAPIISALLTVSENEIISCEDFLYGIIIGYEVAIRLACAVQPTCKQKGFHATGIVGTIGGAIAVGTSLKFDFEQMKSAFSTAITCAAGILEMQENDSELKPLNVGRAAMDAIAAAYIGKARFKAPQDALGGKRGFLRIFSDNPKMEYIECFNHPVLYIQTIYNKPYAACRHCHPAIEAAMDIRKQDGFVLSEIEHIQVETYRLAVKGHEHTFIQGINSAKMSIPYSLAVALVTGHAGLHEYTEEYITDTTILDIASKVVVTEREDLTLLCPQKRIAIVKVQTNKGNFISQVDYPKGEPENPMSDQELYSKVEQLMTFGGCNIESCKWIIKSVMQDEFSLSTIIEKLNH